MMAAFNAGDSGMDWGGLTASGVLVILPVIIFSLIGQKHLVAGLSSGAIKGRGKRAADQKDSNTQFPCLTTARLVYLSHARCQNF
jgi:hypothetical protein